MKVTVIVPVYNTEKYVAKCIQSILSQTFGDFELIIVDDGSTDQSGSVCEKFAQEDNRIVLIHKENAGQGVARNLALERAQGQYFAFLDSDDYWDENYLESMLEVIEQENADISICDFRRVNSQYQMCPQAKERKKSRVYSGVEAARTALYWKDFGVAPWAKLYKRSVWEGVRFKEDRIYEDLATTYLVYLNAKRVAFTSKQLMSYYLRENSDIRISFNERKMMTITTAEEIVAYANSNCRLLRKPAYSRAVASGFFIYLQIPDDPIYAGDKKRCIDIIRRYRWPVITDCHARRKTWCAAVLSLFGVNCVQKVFRSMKKRNPLF